LPGTAQTTLSALADTSMRDQAKGRTKRSTKSSIAAGQLAREHSNRRAQPMKLCFPAAPSSCD